MLYLPHNVPEKQPLNVSAAPYNPFLLPEQTWESIDRVVSTKRRGVAQARTITERLYPLMKCGAPVLGTRTPTQTWKDKQGNCLEQNLLLYTIFQKYGLQPRFLLTKSPAGYPDKPAKDEVIHPFILVEDSRNKLHYADLMFGAVDLYEPEGFALLSQEYTDDEILAHFFIDDGESFGDYRMFRPAMKSLKIGLQINPNNYVGHVVAARVLVDQYCKTSKEVRLDQAYGHLAKAAVLAPGLLEPIKEGGDLAWKGLVFSRGLEIYEAAMVCGTEDISLLDSLIENLLYGVLYIKESDLPQTEKRSLTRRARKLINQTARKLTDLRGTTEFRSFVQKHGHDPYKGNEYHFLDHVGFTFTKKGLNLEKLNRYNLSPS